MTSLRPAFEHDAATFLEAEAMAHVGIWVWDAADGQVQWSPELCRIYGFDPEGFTHDFDRFVATVVEADRHLIEAAMQRAFTHGEGYDFELRIVGEDGVARTLHAVARITVDPATGQPVRIVGTSLDITDRKRAEEAQLQAEGRFRAAFDDAPIGMALVGLDGTLLRVNRAACVIWGRDRDDLLAMTFQDITHPADIDADVEQVRRMIAGEIDAYSMEKRYLRPNGEVVWAELSVSLVSDAAGAPEYFVSQIQDITEAKRLREHLHHLADHDGLTGLPNRRRFDEDLAAQAARAARYGESAALLVLDLDAFKGVNDRFGHREGDAVLKRVSAAIADRLRRSDTAARLGGDEFAVLLPHTSEDQARSVAAGLVAVIAEVAGHGVSASCGVAMLDAAHADGEHALVTADNAMYAAKALLRGT